MDFNNRLKKELSEGIVKALLEDAGYRVIESGIEKVIREINCMNKEEYKNLNFSKGYRTLPDLLVMTKEQTEQCPIEIKYRSGWTLDVFQEIEDQVKLHEEMVLIYINGQAPDTELESPSRYIRCCRLQYRDDKYLFQSKKLEWQLVSQLRDDESQWWGMSLLQNTFPLFNENSSQKTITSAIAAIRGILN